LCSPAACNNVVSRLGWPFGAAAARPSFIIAAQGLSRSITGNGRPFAARFARSLE
jgi:hypothetical protein